MKTRLSALVIACAIGAPSAALACGACIDDSVAATYDHAVIHTAIQTRRQVAFVTIEGPVDATRLAKQVLAKAPRIRGVVSGTVRTSVAPPAFSFALDGTQSPSAMVDAFRSAIAEPRAHLTLVRIMRDGALVEPH